MRLQDYPRPPGDNGIGMHWSAGNPTAVGGDELRKRWLPELKRMGVKWVKHLHDGGLEFAELLLQADIMPVVRIYRSQPNSRDLNKATLGPREIAALKDYVSLGVRYFEFNNEPEVNSEWEGGQVPPDAEALVARAAIKDMETILKHGGYPALPATAIGTVWDLVGKIIELNGQHLFDEAIWISIHNYDINHPLDYPYDAVNQQGQEISQDEYRRLGDAAWNGKRWQRRSREFVNEQRRLGANPGFTIHDDPSCFRAYERFADLCLKRTGRYLPILSTENGPIVGEDDDPRYPTTTPELHTEKVVEQAKIMMGQSASYPAAPPYYFCTAFWLMGNAVLRATGWEEHAWFSNRWPGGKLPVVDALAALPKVERPTPTDELAGILPIVTAPSRSLVGGMVHGQANVQVFLRSSHYSDVEVTDARGAYRFSGLPAGDYRLTIPAAQFIRRDLQLDGLNQLRVDVGNPPPPPPPPPPPAPQEEWRFEAEQGGSTPGFGIIRVSVEGRVGLAVRVSAKGWEGYTRNTGSKPEHGPYALEFAPLGAGRYTITPAEIGISAEIDINASQITTVRFLPAGVAAASAVRGRVRNGAGATVVLKGPTGEWRARAGDDGSFAFTGLAAGVYTLSVLDSDIAPQELHLDGKNELKLTLALPRHAREAGSVVSGVVSGGEGFTIVLRRSDGQERATVIGPDGSYRFEGLAAGTYSLHIMGADTRRTGLVLDGSNSQTVKFTLGTRAMSVQSSLVGEAPGSNGCTLELLGPSKLRIEHVVDANGRFAFMALAGGDYELRLHSPTGVVTRAVVINEGEETSIHFDRAASPRPTVSYEISDGGIGPGFGVVRARFDGRAHLPVRIWTHGWAGITRTIGEKWEYGDVCEFAPLGAGVYFVEPEGSGAQAEVTIDGSRITWVTFKQIADEGVAGAPAQPIEHYLLVGALPADLPTLLAVLDYVARFAPVVGASVHDAMAARHVTLFGSTLTISAAAEAELVAAGCETDRVAPNVAASTFRQRIADGRPF